MKRFLLSLFLLIGFACTGMAQSEAMYVWRNDGDFNAFLKSDIDSIGYSHLDADSVYHNEWQQQVVYTKNGNFSIPLSAIDSVSFRAPETVVSKDVFQLTAAHDAYLSLCDTISFTLSSATPSTMRPSVGNVVVSTYDCLSFPNGIMARVVTKKEDASGIHYECEKVGIDEVYDQLVMVGTCYAEDENPANSASLKPKDIEIIVDKTAWDKSWKKTFEKGGTSTALDINDNAHIVLTIRIQKGKQPYFRLDLVNELKSSITFNASSSFEQDFKERFFNQTLGRILIPGAPLLYITPKLSLSAYFAEEGEVSLDYTGHCNRTDKVSFICQGNKWTTYHTPKTDVGVDVASLSMKGYAEVGLIPDMLFSLNGSATGVGVKYSVGVKEAIDFKFDAVSLFDEGMYSALKDSYARTTVPQQITLYASMGLWGGGVIPYSYTLPQFEPQWGTDKYLLPLFSKPTYSQGSMTSKANFKSTISRSLLFPVEVGMAYYEGDTRLQTKYLTPKYQSPSSWNLNGLESTFDNIETGKTYTAYPVVRLMGKTLRAVPSTTFPELHACPDSHHPHAIDLGLPSGTKWACCNVGAKTPEAYGGYYAWGETSEKSYYYWDTYAYGSNWDNVVNIGSNIAGTVYDVAHVRMGGSWRMPTIEQQQELRDNCTRQWTTQNGVNGTLVTGPNGGQIFLPAAGSRWDDVLYYEGEYGYCWSASLNPSDVSGAYSLRFPSGGWNWSYYYRYYGQSVRAVCP